MARLLECLAILTLVAHVSYGSGYPCLDGWFYDYATERCYKVVNSERSWIDARTFCREEGGDLAAFETESKLPYIFKYPALIARNVYYWIGLNDRKVEGEFKWNMGNETATYLNWGRHFPIGRGIEEYYDCGAIIKSREVLEWQNRQCLRTFRFVCQRLRNEQVEAYKAEHEAEQDVTCPDGWERVSFRRKCVKTVNENVDYNTAMHRCHALIPGKTDLLDVPDFEVLDYFSGRLAAGNYWIAPTDQQQEGVFTATTLPGAKRVTYLPWKKGSRRHTIYNCVWLYTNGRKGWENSFQDVQCTLRKPYICQFDPPAPKPKDKVCPRGWKKFAASETCFKVESEITGTWTRARRECKKIGGDLATIPDQKTQDFVKGIISDDRYWIGLVDVKNTGTFAWVGKDIETEQSQLDNLAGNDLGTKDCVEIIGSRGGVWKDRNCNAKRNFICEKEATLPNEG